MALLIVRELAIRGLAAELAVVQEGSGDRSCSPIFKMQSFFAYDLDAQAFGLLCIAKAQVRFSNLALVPFRACSVDPGFISEKTLQNGLLYGSVALPVVRFLSWSSLDRIVRMTLLQWESKRRSAHGRLA